MTVGGIAGGLDHASRQRAGAGWLSASEPILLQGRTSMINPETDRILITGAAGAIGTALRDGLRPHWRHLRLTDIKPIQNLTNNEEAIVADVTDRPAIENMMQGVKAVVHLAGMIGNYNLETLFQVNARGLFD